MSVRGSTRAAQAAVAALAAALACALAAAPAEARDDVRVISTGNSGERVSKLPITRKAGAARRTVFALPKRRIPRLRAGDRLRAGLEMQFTNNCIRPEPRCVGPTYKFSPTLEARVVLRGKGVRRRLGKGTERCGQEDPHREHHCVLVIPPRTRTLRRDDACKSCRVEVEVTAHARGADGSQRIMVGGLRPDGSIPQDRGRLDVAVLRRGSPRARVGSTSRLRRGSSPIDLKRRVVLSKPLRGLRRGEQFEVDARIRESIAHLPYTVRTSSHLILANDPDAVEPDRRTARISLTAGELGESNGFNCPRPARTCTTRKLGMTRLFRSAKRLYVNLVLFTGPKRAKARPGDAARLGPGRIVVRRYPPQGGR